MSIFSIRKGKVARIKEMKFDYERNLQKLVEENLNELFGLEFVKSEFEVKGTHQNLFFDTLAFDPQTNAFVIIEYKKDRNFSVIDQGYSFSPIQAAETQDSIAKYTESSTVKKISAQIRTFTLEDHRKKASDETRALLDSLRAKIFTIDTSVKEKPFKVIWAIKLIGIPRSRHNPKILRVDDAEIVRDRIT